MCLFTFVTVICLCGPEHTINSFYLTWNIFVIFFLPLKVYCLFSAVQSVSSQSGTAIGGLDYTDISSQELTFIPGGPTEQDIVVGINDDNLLEGTEFFLLTVSSQNANTRIGNYENTTVRILDDDGKCFVWKNLAIT